ncbi:MAG: aminoglycoside 6-adenylyltransferase [Promethearchaeota archaeon]|jgi:aminoglycoside 6-adenylyltransferase
MKEETQRDQLYKDLEEKFLVWANQNDDIRGAVICGSRGQNNPPADEWADLDVAIYTTNPDSLTDNSEWLNNFGEPVLSYIFQILGLSKEHRVLFKSGLEVDFAISLYDKEEYIRLLDHHPEFVDWVDLFGFGWRIILDKDGILDQIFTILARRERSKPAYLYNAKIIYMDQSMPSESEFLHRTTDLLHHFYMVAKLIRRGELWKAKRACSDYKGYDLYEYFTWHTYVYQGLKCDLEEDLLRNIYRKKNFEKWIDPRILNELKHIYSSYDEDEVWQELLKILELFDWIVREIADKMGYQFPDEKFQNVKQLVKNLYSRV